MTKIEADQLKDEVDARGRHGARTNIGLERGQYPPFALTAWDDRARFRQYVFDVIDEFVVKYEHGKKEKKG